ncbi:histone-lysine N-methyltransferase, H3 lysine-79 specific-like [Zophobas morio]|uniref:histone-lysine N-methyltransferase, H3 lysine-79 specific-like n=1 Tax=Zophobas morio TaxID=2755281 RepID=UPI0030839160
MRRKKKELIPTEASDLLLSHITRHVYNKAIDDISRLNKYKSFSEEVYGEFNFNLMQEIIATVPIGQNDRFIDLGSGVGQVVLQVAGQTRCVKSYGIEKRMDLHNYATRQNMT